MKLTGKLTISRISGGDDDDRISITFEDGPSGCEAIEIRCTPEAFALALTGLACQPAVADFNDGGAVGKKREWKWVTVFRPDSLGYSPKPERLAELLSPFEVDGWKARTSDLANSHNRIAARKGGAEYKVLFERYVPAEPGTQQKETE